MPLHIYQGLSGQLVTTVLKPGRRSKASHVFDLLHRLITRLRESWPSMRIIFRGDAHFSSPKLMNWCHQQPNVHFITGLSGNKRLHALAAPIIRGAQSGWMGARVKDQNQYRAAAQLPLAPCFWQSHASVRAPALIATSIVIERSNFREFITLLIHLPMQNREKIESNRSSVVISPVMVPSSLSAARRSIARKSPVMPLSSARSASST